jgi:hypothetical protein
MQTQTETQQAQQRQGRLIFLLMTTFFVVPIVVVILMYKLNWKPMGQSHGELVLPPRLIQDTQTMIDSDGKRNPKIWADKWSMVYIADDCEQACMEKLSTMRQLHVSLYKDIMRTQRVLITSNLDVRNIKTNFPDMVVINQPVEAVQHLSKQFDIDGENAAKTGRIYFVDPLGHIMMSYKSTTAAADIRKDLVHLLRYSWAG